MAQSAVEWLVEQLTKQNEIYGCSKELLEQAKEMEKQHIFDAYTKGFSEGTCFGACQFGYIFITSEQYYNETFKKK